MFARPSECRLLMIRASILVGTLVSGIFLINTQGYLSPRPQPVHINEIDHPMIVKMESSVPGPGFYYPEYRELPDPAASWGGLLWHLSFYTSPTQLTTYAAAYQVDHGRPCRELLLDTLVKTKTPGRQLLTTHRTKADFCVLLARINAMLASIKTGVFTAAAPDAWWCSSKWCGYSRTCKFFNPERK